MFIMDWKDYFEKHILERGLEYYNINAVRIYQYDSERIEAQVAGSRIYNVVINFSDSDITSMYCDCPYFEGYDYCKHLAATLYYIDDHPELLDEEDYTELLSSLSYLDLFEFLSKELPKNRDLANKLKLFKSDEIDEEFYMDKLIGSLPNSFEILKFMDREINDLISQNQFNLVFKLLREIIDHINSELEYGEFPFMVEIISKIDFIITQIRDDVPIEFISDFLEYAISSSDDYYILDRLTDCMSRNGDIERLS